MPSFFPRIVLVCSLMYSGSLVVFESSSSWRGRMIRVRSSSTSSLEGRCRRGSREYLLLLLHDKIRGCRVGGERRPVDDRSLTRGGETKDLLRVEVKPNAKRRRGENLPKGIGGIYRKLLLSFEGERVWSYLRSREEGVREEGIVE